MTYLNTRKKYEYLSNAILGVFFLLLVASAIITDIFHIPLRSAPELLGVTSLFKNEELAAVTKITLKNKSGLFTFEKLDKNQISPWHMTAPRDVTANSIFIEKLFHALANNKVKNFLPNDKINQSNFSLEKPNTTLTLESSNQSKPIIMDIGLVNTIDNTTFVRISNKENILQVEVPNIVLENITILDLIESKIFSIDLESINSFKIVFLKTGAGGINIHKKNSKWVSNDESLLPQDKIEEYFQDISVIKSSFVLDEQTAQQKKQIASLMRNPEITLTAEDNKKNLITYKISSLIYKFPDIDLKNSPYFIVSISNNQTAYIVKKDFLELFNKKF